MTRPDTVFAYFVDANPVPDETMAPDSIPSFDRRRPVAETLTALPHRAPRRGPLLAAAAFALVVVAGLALALVSLRSTEPEPADPEELLLREAVVAIEDHLAAIDDGDIEGVMARLAEHERTVANRHVYEWRSAFSAAGLAWTLGDCELDAMSETRVEGRCTLSLNDPVANELGAGEQVVRYTYEDGLLIESDFEGDSMGAANGAYSEYVRTFYEDDYLAVCQPGAYEPGTIVQTELLALTGDCASLAAPLADDVVSWIRSGRPTG